MGPNGLTRSLIMECLEMRIKGAGMTYGEMQVPELPEVPEPADGLSEPVAREALSMVLAAVASANEILQRPREGVLTSEYDGDLLKKLKEWIKKLYAAIRAIAEALPAMTYSITAGTTISVTVTFGSNP